MTGALASNCLSLVRCRLGFMPRLFAALLVAGLVLPASGGDALAQQLATYESPTNGFSFQYPTSWRTAPAEVEVSIGNTIERVAYVSPDQAVILIVSVTQLNARVSEAEVPRFKSEFDSVMQQIAQQVGGTLVQSDLVDGSDVGRRHLFVVQFEYEELGDTIQSRQYHFFEADRQYTIVLEGEAEDQDVHAETFDGVLSSFTVQPR